MGGHGNTSDKESQRNCPSFLQKPDVLRASVPILLETALAQQQNSKFEAKFKAKV